MRGNAYRSPVVIGGGGFDLLDNIRLHGGDVCGEVCCRSTGSEHDLAAMVSDFIEFGSTGAESWCSSDTDSGFFDLAFLAEKISCCNSSIDQYESNLAMVVKSLVLSISETIQRGEHEFIDVITHENNEDSQRYIIDIDFRSHFQIARAVKPYKVVLSSLPPI
ncbi:uncharacterized protein [Primulina eburnea]|uniref:uncharacterized protein isoform X2 n=1 Tax=Primulina eburnea TaxID=1245227 RepID=UPI003C6CA842